jgi:hypothetical protein
MDHASIYLLIAGTYTPFVLIVLQGSIGWIIFGISWGMAIVGITLKVFYRALSVAVHTDVSVHGLADRVCDSPVNRKNASDGDGLVGSGWPRLYVWRHPLCDPKNSTLPRHLP